MKNSKGMPEDKFQALLQQVTDYSNVDIPWVDYLKDISGKLIDFSRCDEVELHIKIEDRADVWDIIKRTRKSFNLEILSFNPEGKKKLPFSPEFISNFLNFYKDKPAGKYDRSLPFFTQKGSFCTGDIGKTLTVYPEKILARHYYSFRANNDVRSMAIIPIVVGFDRKGILQLMSSKKDFFSRSDIEGFENLTPTLGLAIMSKRSQATLKERVKEMTCLYGIATAVERHGTSLDRILESTVELIPPAWQYPEITEIRIVLNGDTFSTPGFRTSPYNQTTDIVVKGRKRGFIEVVYLEEKQEFDEGPFLEEERKLLDTIARELSLLTERIQAELEEQNLHAQLRHADRLATIGQLASGIAHEVNEPLCNILGFAQLAEKDPELPDQTNLDLQKIINAALHARLIVKKLLIFSRQMPTTKIKVNLNELVKEGLYFFESRCAKEGIDVQYTLDPELPEIVIDPSQIKQVIVNLVVNAIQAMPKGGKLIIQTKPCSDYVSLSVNDTGTGMHEEVLKQIFLPFFTTKDVGEGTGLGLSVVHGIVSSHGGTIDVRSAPGTGSHFEVLLPLTHTVELEEEVEVDNNA
jgi:signal transduction histidine kinase